MNFCIVHYNTIQVVQHIWHIPGKCEPDCKLGINFAKTQYHRIHIFNISLLNVRPKYLVVTCTLKVTVNISNIMKCVISGDGKFSSLKCRSEPEQQCIPHITPYLSPAAPLSQITCNCWPPVQCSCETCNLHSHSLSHMQVHIPNHTRKTHQYGQYNGSWLCIYHLTLLSRNHTHGENRAQY